MMQTTESNDYIKSYKIQAGFESSNYEQRQGLQETHFTICRVYLYRSFITIDTRSWTAL